MCALDIQHGTTNHTSDNKNGEKHEMNNEVTFKNELSQFQNYDILSVLTELLDIFSDEYFKSISTFLI